MKYTNTFNSMPTYGQIESGLFHKPAVIKSVCPKCHGLGEIQITTDNRFTCTRCCGTGQTVL